jgi:hypothetical protein
MSFWQTVLPWLEVDFFWLIVGSFLLLLLWPLVRFIIEVVGHADLRYRCRMEA